MLYLLGDTIIGPVGLQHAQMDGDAIIVLIKDGVFLDLQAVQGKKVYAIDEDVKRRGMGGRLKDKAEIIDREEGDEISLCNVRWEELGLKGKSVPAAMGDKDLATQSRHCAMLGTCDRYLVI